MSESESMMSVQPVIENCVGAFCHKYRQQRLDHEELLLEAQVWALDAIRSFNDTGTLEGWVGYKIKTQLTGRVRRRAWCNRFRAPNTVFRPENQIDPKTEAHAFSLCRFLEGLSSDAQRVLRVLLRTGSKRLTVNKLLRSGWFAEGVEDIFSEIRREANS